MNNCSFLDDDEEEEAEDNADLGWDRTGPRHVMRVEIARMFLISYERFLRDVLPTAGGDVGKKRKLNKNWSKVFKTVRNLLSTDAAELLMSGFVLLEDAERG